jgi:two-component system OmpR family response regulator
MSSAATIIFARADLSIPGTATGNPGEDPAEIEARFFDLLRNNRPDVAVLDFTAAGADGIDTILKIRQHSSVPILIVCATDDPLIEEYRIAGAADCLCGPVNIVVLNGALQRIIRVTQRYRCDPAAIRESMTFAGITYSPRGGSLSACGRTIELTSSEERALAHFLLHPQSLCSRAEMAGVLYGQREVGDRAVAVVINRLRKKLAALRGADGEHLIKTEFGRGYILMADVRAGKPPTGPLASPSPAASSSAHPEPALAPAEA